MNNEIKGILDYITNLQQENEELKKKLDRKYYKNEYERIKEENERLKEIKPCMLNFQECYIVKDFKYRCEKASEYFKCQLEDLDFYEDTKARMLCAMGITLLQNGSDSQ